jgi:undecaprenyl-diphosphatase
LSLFQAFVLGVVQGATEFLPVSSSGHLVLAPWLLGWRLDPGPAFIFDVLVQWGTIAAVMVYFRVDLWELCTAGVRSLRGGEAWREPMARRAWLILAASLPAAVLGLLIKSTVEIAFSSPLAVAVFLMGTSLLLTVAEWTGKRERKLDSLGWLDAIVIGLFQALALFPGVSRSGSTIAGGLLRGMAREQAARFSFLLAVPVMLGAGLVALLDLGQAANAAAQTGPLLVGFVTAALVGFAAIHWLLTFLRTRRLYGFAIYCALLSLGSLLIYALG